LSISDIAASAAQLRAIRSSLALNGPSGALSARADQSSAFALNFAAFIILAIMLAIRVNRQETRRRTVAFSHVRRAQIAF
jgi:hypothetical protein